MKIQTNTPYNGRNTVLRTVKPLQKKGNKSIDNIERPIKEILIVYL